MPQIEVNHPVEDRNDRREFLKIGAWTGLTAAMAGLNVFGCASADRRTLSSSAPAMPMTNASLDSVRIGFVGLGGMGSNHVEYLLAIPGARICAVCDIVEEKVHKTQDLVERAGQPRPTGYSCGPRDFERMCETADLDVVYNATPWEWHVPICLSAMKNGKHAVTEVPAAYTTEGCWQLVESAEKFQKHCVMLENCCYDREEMMVLNMVRKGLFGQLLHGECGYLHDLRGIKFSKDGEGLWRRKHATQRDGNFYPTHGIGPIAQCMDINRGDQFDYLVSMSGPSRGLQLWREQHVSKDDPRWKEDYILGDINVSLIKTKRGRTIYIAHDTNLPRPYSRIHMLQGTQGIFEGYPDRIHLEGRSPAHRWEPAEKYFVEYDHPLWKSEKVKMASGGHGGMDYLENYRIIECLRTGQPMDMDVYDAAAWSVICAATEESVANRSKPVDIPDFTRGAWKTRPPLGIVTG